MRVNENYIPEVAAYLMQDGRSFFPDYFKNIEENAYAREVPIVPREVAKFLALLVQLKQPSAILELGTAIGYSALALQLYAPAHTLIRSIELSKDNVREATRNIATYAMHKNIEIVQAEILSYLHADTTTYDYIFADAQKGQYAQYLELCLPRLAKGGVIIFDNLLWHGQVVGVQNELPRFQKARESLQAFNKMFLNHLELQSVILPIGDGVGMGVKR